MIKLNEIAPDLAARVVADEEHRRTCTEAPCELCGRAAPAGLSAEPFDSELRDVTVARVLEWIPTAYVGAELGAQWLVELVGASNVARARGALSAHRVAFLGPPGAGKTSLAAAMYRARVRAETAVSALSRFRWVSGHQLSKARAGHPLGAGEAPLVEAAIRAPLLVLDELGAEDPRYASAVAEVLYERHADQLPTWVTTGVGSKEIASRYGGGIARRVFEDATVFRLGKQ